MNALLQRIWNKFLESEKYREEKNLFFFVLSTRARKRLLNFNLVYNNKV